MLVVSHGYFGERWAAIAQGYGLEVDHVRYEWGELPSADEVGARLEEIGGAKVVYLTHSDTSTGGVADVQATAERIAGSGALIAVDAISSLAAVPLETDDWGFDIVLTSSHKALMCPAGPRLRRRSRRLRSRRPRRRRSPRYYMDWQRAIAAQAKGETPFSTAISLVRGLDVALDIILADGPRGRARAAPAPRPRRRAGVKAMGLELFSPDADSAAVVTAIRMPAESTGRRSSRSMRERSGRHDHRRPGPAARARSSASATSATWTCRTSPPRSPRSSARSSKPAPTSSAAAAVPAALEAHAEPVAA